MIGLFAGVGGIEFGFEQSGFRVIGANELDAQASITYRENHKGYKLVEGDICDVSGDSFEIPSHENGLAVLAGGFPCQPFSVAGHRRGFDDHRGNVFWEIHRLIKELNPEVVFLENVKNLETHDSKKTFQTIRGALTGEIASPLKGVGKLPQGYVVKSKVLNAKDFGIPQNRERIFIVAFRDPEAAHRFKFPDALAEGEPALSIRDVINFETPVAAKYYYTEKTPFYETLKEHVIDEGTIYQWRRQYVRANKSGVCPTLTANMGMGGHNVPIILTKSGIRKLTPAECFAVMGFPAMSLPKELPDSAFYKQAGNAVVVPVIKALAQEVLRAIRP